MSSLKQLVPHSKRVHPQRKKSRAKAHRCAQAAHGYQAASKKAQRAQRHKRAGHARDKKASKDHGPPQ